jgi:hypothetical protein
MNCLRFSNRTVEMSVGYVYKIYYGDLCYYGSSRDAEERIKGHKYQYNFYKKKEGKVRICTSYILFELAEEKEEQPSSEILEKYDDISDEDLLKRENYYIDNNYCVNERRAIRTDEELSEWRKEYSKIYRETKKDYIKKNQKLWYEENKEHVYIRNKIYCEKNKDKVAEYQKIYKENHKEERKEYIKKYCESEKNKEKNKERNKRYREKKKQQQLSS